MLTKNTTYQQLFTLSMQKPTKNLAFSDVIVLRQWSTTDLLLYLKKCISKKPREQDTNDSL